MTYRVGELDQLIDIKREVRVSDGAGGFTTSRTDVAADLWAHARPRSGKEIGVHNRVEAPAMYLFVVRYRSDVKENDIIVWDGDDYNIRAILTRGGRSMYLEIDAERGVTQ